MSNRRTEAKGHTIKDHLGQSKCQYTQNLIGIPYLIRGSNVGTKGLQRLIITMEMRYGKVLL